ncbi:unnamed protein product [Vitrella brassicaformis CCMP3155]|uniref:Uncharacterized protein n=1 Tax=Vitrella brassicaformis (strain CCMP3155) TaxID=1169540 RepID=A0A0G4GSC0_VITBC|nr:unnamed protein product [Vitrella brassicaformis CCMP3155]|eukprot:CEM33500.1 unnamed protein product [Vitrella brassicaformis CCMP3155]
MALSQGMQRYIPGYVNNLTNNLILLWVITLLALASVVSGLKAGIKFLSELCFVLGNFILIVVLFADDTWYILNIYVQNLGLYFQQLLAIGTHTDAFVQLGLSSDGAGANPTWMNDWTLFYWGWWTAFAPFVGLFIARISRGRSIKQVIAGAMAAPVVYTFFWFSVFGGAGLRMEREAALQGIDCDTPVDGASLVRLSCRKTTDMWYDVLGHYDGLGYLLCILSLVALLIYFLTTNDSGSLIIDSLADNGNIHTTVLTRVFWALTEGATATALSVAGGEAALSALQTGAIVTGCIFTVVLGYMCASLLRICRIIKGDIQMYPWQ